MARSDWKKILTSKERNTWMHKKNKILIKADKTANKDWVVYSDRYLFPTKHFKTKMQALRHVELQRTIH